VEDPSLVFPVLDPHQIFASYFCETNVEDLAGIDVEDPSDVLTLVVAIIGDDPLDSTVNLKAPLLINHRKMLGRQVILNESRYSVRTPILDKPQGSIHTDTGENALHHAQRM
jgi:flagellar assembly factor FliW